MPAVIGAEVRFVVGDPFNIAWREYDAVIVLANSSVPRHVLVSSLAPVPGVSAW